MRPTIRPGLTILRRDLRTLQVGLEWTGVATVQDDESIRTVLAAVDGFRDVAGIALAAAAGGVPRQQALEAVEALLEAGVLIDQAVVKPPEVADEVWSAMWLLAGPGGTAETVLSSRRQVRVCLEGTGRVATSLTALLAGEHVPMTTEPSDATLVVVAADAEPDRAVADDAMRRGLPFLCVGVRELVGLVGPFVVPGRTACLRCVDLDRAQLDPCWTTLVASLQVRPAATPPAPPSLLSAVAGYAAQEVALWASGSRPVCWDNVVEIPHGLGEIQTVAFPPNPQCGCGWAVERERMGA